MNILKSIDSNTLYFIQNHVQSPYLTPIMFLITKSVYIWVPIAIILLCFKKFRIVGILTICSLILTTILCEGILKNLVQRPRPFDTLKGLHLLIKAPASYSFPSWSTAAAFACAIIIAYYIQKAVIPAIGLAVLTGFSRIYFTVHYPSDVIGGMLIGSFCAFFTIYIYKKIKNKSLYKKI